MVLTWQQSQVSHAATGMTNVMTGTTFVPRPSGNSLTDTGGSLAYPTLEAVTANNLENGRLTTKTTQIAITFSDTVTMNTKYVKINDFYYDVMTAGGVSLRTNGPEIIGTNTTSINLGSGKTQTISVDLSHLKDVLPVYIGFRYTPSTFPNLNVGYQFGSFTADATVSATIKPTITGSLTSKDTVIKGTGSYAGDTISSDVNGVTTTVGSDKTYTLDLGSALGSTSSVRITESNSNGDSGSVTGNVAQKSLDLKVANATIAAGPNDVTTEMSDSEVLTWLTKQIEPTATFSDGSSTADVTYQTGETGLAAKIAALGSGDSINVEVYAQVGTTKSSPQTITIKKTAGTLSFGPISGSIGFGTLAIPTKEAIYQPSSKWEVNISDTRATGSKWYVYASATPLKSDSHTLKGDLIYQDGANQAVLTNQSMLVANGARGTANTTAVTSDWSSTKGIFLDVQPSVYADSYQGKVNWSLQSTPTE